MSKPYPSYKDSDVESLGKIPGHWAVKPLKALASVNDETLAEDTDAEYEIEYVDIGSVTLTDGILKTETFLFKEAPSRARRLVKDGDVLVSTVRTYLKAIAPVENPASNLVASTGFAVVRPGINFSSRFAHYVLQSPSFVEEVIARSTGVSYPAINASDMARILLPAPPISEQSFIAAFLDHETAKIDALVEEQRRLIELLKEKRRGVISHAVTKGLNPNAPMKDSGIEWLGKVPGHWTIAPLKHAGIFAAGAGFPHEEQGMRDEELPFYKVNALGQADEAGYLTPSENTISEDTAKRLRAYIFPPKAIVFAKIGAALLLGRIRMLRARACLDNNLMGFVSNNSHEVDFMRYLFEQIRFDLIANPGTVPSLNESQISGVAFAIPPKNEQAEIAAYLNSQAAKFSALVSDAEALISLLLERRAALISAGVTGKIDVRGFAAKEAEVT